MFFKRTNKYQGVAVLSEQREYISEPEKIRQALKQTGNYGFDLYDDREKIGFILLRQFSEKGFFYGILSLIKNIKIKVMGQSS
ncbi:hypothetical protein ACFQOY_10875 [Enterococcus alcedinis]|uniref:hypothetical protein n=1 Tax=Enterococcus alcedinis TaxID=1274384 RepID=UPI0036106CAC